MWQTKGQEKAVGALYRGLIEGRLSHAYLLIGPPHIGKMTLALDLSRLVNCTETDKPCGNCQQCSRITNGLHTDVRILEIQPDLNGNNRSRISIGIDQVRMVQKEASLKPYEGKYRVFIFNGAEHFSEEAANALLKTLEEPPHDVILVLLACEFSQLPTTLTSRCMRIELKQVSSTQVRDELESEYGISRDQALEIAKLSGGRLGWAIESSRDPSFLKRQADKMQVINNAVHGNVEDRLSLADSLSSLFAQDRESGYQEVDHWLQWWRDVMVMKEGAPDLISNLSQGNSLQEAANTLSLCQITSAIGAIVETSNNLERNVNPRLAFEELMLRLPWL